VVFSAGLQSETEIAVGIESRRDRFTYRLNGFSRTCSYTSAAVHAPAMGATQYIQ
jgi:hypothetical protein